MFRTCLHPTRVGLVGGIVLIALWVLLWAWFLVGIARGPDQQARLARAVPDLAQLVTSETGFIG
jgi:hypothetical protein